MPSRIGDKTWTHGERDSTRFHQKRSLPIARLDDPTPEALRQAIADQRCWWCDREGFKALANHTAMAHGIFGADIRRLAGLVKSATICSPERSEQMRQAPRAQAVKAGLIVLVQDKTKKRVMSEAGKIINRAKLDAIPNKEENRRKASARKAEVARRPHPCPVCQTIIPKAHPITCSPACRKVIRRKTALAAVITRYGEIKERCMHLGCTEKHLAKGLCSKHYQQTKHRVEIQQ